jgi:C4-dicarboxylate-specific signal transduction histidine kinase
MIIFDSEIRDVLILYVSEESNSEVFESVQTVLKDLILDIKYFDSIAKAESFYKSNIEIYKNIIIIRYISYQENIDYIPHFEELHVIQNRIPLILLIPQETDLINKVSLYNIYNFVLTPVDKDSVIDKIDKISSEIKQKNEIQRVNKELHDKDIMLQQQTKLAIMGEMISMIAHQWKQPLAGQKAILSNLELKRRLKKLEEDYLHDKLKTISELSSYMAKTIDDFADFFKPDKEKRITNISNAIDDCISLTSGVFKNKDVKVYTTLDINLKDDLKLEIFDREFKQVVINILNNAKDALIENNVEDKSVIVTISKTDQSVVIEIADNAGGIPSHIINKIFDPYFSTKSKNGTGLGLYMSKIIIDDHLNGLLSASNNSVGAVFKIELPLES